MNTRELIILLLGFVIVGIVLRGLYSALKARRGQIRLAIDKNIPQDVDLEALELAELPGGGARIVDRTEDLAAGLSAVTAANLKAQQLDLGGAVDDGNDIPVLMDAVELSEAAPVSIQEAIDFEDDLPEPDTASVDALDDLDDWDEGETDAQSEDADDSFADDIEHSLGEHFETPEPAATEAADERFDEAADDVLFDYDESEVADNSEADIADSYGQSPQQHTAVDGLASVMPDYPDQEAAIADPIDAPAESTDSSFHSAVDDAFEPEAQYADAEHREGADLDAGYDEDDFEDSSEDRLGHDYAESREEHVDEHVDEHAEEHAEEYAEEASAEDDVTEDWQDEVADSQQDEYEVEEEQAQPQPGSTASFEAGLEEFSMSAGERIGYGENASEEPQAAEPVVPAKRRSLFGFFKRKPIVDAAESDDVDDFFEDEALPEIQATAPVESVEQSDQQTDTTGGSEFEQDFAEEQEFDSYAADDSSESPVSQDEPLATPYSDNERAAQPVAAVVDDEPQSAAQLPPSQPTEVIVLNVMARDGYNFAGHDLLEVLVTSGLKFGEMNIFHRRLNNEPKGPVVFSVANVLNPGSFDLNAMDEFTTLGVSLFLAMPSPINNLEAFNQMLDVADQIRDQLNGELKDDNRNVMTAQTVEHYRQRIRDFELRCLKAAGGRG